MIAPRIAIGGIVHETHTFVQPPTTLDDFRTEALLEGEALLRWAAGTRSAIAGFADRAETYGWLLLPTVYASAPPGGTVAAAAFNATLDVLTQQLQSSLPVDGVFLALHGAMVAESVLDAESIILEHVRAVVGNVPIVVELDMHGNISRRTVELADVLVAFNTNPHIDAYERAQEGAELMARLLQHEIKPTATIVQPPLLLVPQATDTSDLPLRAVHERAAAIRADPRVLNICVMGGFAYADTPDTGPSIIVATDANPTLAQTYAEELCELLLEHSRAALPPFLPPHEAVAMAMQVEPGPVILVDSADNIGGGTPGDGTDALRAMLDLGASGAVVINDSEAVGQCVAAGEGATVTLHVGGKTDRWHGEPVRVNGTVERLSDGSFPYEMPNNHASTFGGGSVEMGPSALLKVGDINLVLSSRKTPPFDLAQLRGMGVQPETQQMIAVKSAVAYRAAYMPIAAQVIEMDTRGLTPPSLAHFPFKYAKRATAEDGTS